MQPHPDEDTLPPQPGELVFLGLEERVVCFIKTLTADLNQGN